MHRGKSKQITNRTMKKEDPEFVDGKRQEGGNSDVNERRLQSKPHASHASMSKVCHGMLCTFKKLESCSADHNRDDVKDRRTTDRGFIFITHPRRVSLLCGHKEHAAPRDEGVDKAGNLSSIFTESHHAVRSTRNSALAGHLVSATSSLSSLTK